MIMNNNLELEVSILTEGCPYVTPCGFCYKFDKICENKDKKHSKNKVPEHDGCVGCRYENNTSFCYPCNQCKHSYLDKYINKKKVWLT